MLSFEPSAVHLNNLQFEHVLDRPDGLYVDTVEASEEAEALLDELREKQE